MCLKALGDHLSSTKRVLVTLWEMPRVESTFSAMLTEQQIRFGKCPNKSRDPMGKFSQGSPANRKQEDLLACSPACLHIHISGIFYLFHQSIAVLLNLIKDRRFNRKILKPSAFLLLIFSLQLHHLQPISVSCDSPFKRPSRVTQPPSPSVTYVYMKSSSSHTTGLLQIL